MNRARGEKDVNPRALGRSERFPSAINILFVAPRQTTDRRAANLLRDLMDGLEIARRCDRKTGLDNVDSQIRQHLCDLELLGNVHARAGRLFTVAQRRVENLDDAVRHGRLREESLRAKLVEGFKSKITKKP